MPSLLPSPSIDLTRLPAPDVVEILSYEAILADMVATLRGYDQAQFDALLETDPAYIVLQVAAYRELLIRQRVNDASHANMLAYAEGGDLDNLAAMFGVARLVRVEADPENNVAEVLEGDDDLRERVLLAPDSYSVAGPAGAYVYHARSASGLVGDATAISLTPGDVIVSVLRWDGDGTAEQDLLDAVGAAVNADTVRPLTDRVTVQSAEVEEFEIDIDLYVFDGPDRSIVVDEARASLERWLDLNRRLGRDKPLSAIIAAAHVAGVQRLVVNSPESDLVHDATQASHCTAITLRIAGVDE